MKALQFTTTSCSSLQCPEKEILAYQQLLVAVEDELATAGDLYNEQRACCNGSRKAQPSLSDYGPNFKRGYRGFRDQRKETKKCYDRSIVCTLVFFLFHSLNTS